MDTGPTVNLTAVFARIVHEVLSGTSRIALAITEPEAGSDVQGLQTEARLSADGTHFTVNGQKKVSLPLSPELNQSSLVKIVDHFRNVFELLIGIGQGGLGCFHSPCRPTNQRFRH